ncbi:hypothetical protein GF376_03040 [Candidatus Peregrinibacteria bacterium]|nr:hypothetical protein [Candidatus Peregrinibacteria bacterium]
MNNVLKIMAVGSLATLAFAACQQAPSTDMPPEEVIQTGLSNLSEVNAYSFDISMNADLQGPEGQPPAEVDFNMDAEGSIDINNPNDPKLNLKMNGDFSADADGGSAEFELRMNKENVYMNLMSLTGEGQVEVPDEMVSMFVNKWWTLPVPPEALEELSNTLPQGNDENLTPEQREMKELVDNTNFFKDIEYVGYENVMGVASYHYTANLDKTAFAEFITEAAQIAGESISEAEMQEINNGLEGIEFNGDMYVAQDSMILNRVSGTVTIDTEDPNNPTGTVKFDFIAGNFDESVVVEVPENATPVPLDQLFGAPGMTTVPSTTEIQVEGVEDVEEIQIDPSGQGELEAEFEL